MANGRGTTAKAKPEPQKSNGKRPTGSKSGLTIARRFTTPEVHPYDEIHWERRKSSLVSWTGKVSFEQDDVEFPVSWSQNATNIVAEKYFRGKLNTASREWSARQIIDRVVDSIAAWGEDQGRFGTEDDREAYAAELKHILVTQKASFNSPVWFNIGVPGRRQVCSACFILHVDDSIDSIADWYRDEMFIFQGGSGSGLNVSNLRSSYEQISVGGYSSGPVTFMRGADASAGTIKSGGATRRAAKMVVFNVDHPDLLELRDGSPGFVWCKAVEEKKARALKAAGFDMAVDSGVDAYSIQYQNANNSVRVTDEFMAAYNEGREWQLRAVMNGDVVKTYQAREIMRQVSDAAWQCADPGMQYHTTINDWHTAPAAGPITASNPCFAGDTLVHTDKGLIRIDELVQRAAHGETFGVYTHDATNPDAPAERVEVTTPDAYMVTGTNEVWRVELQNGMEVRCTPDHGFWTMNRGWVAARDLREDDQVKVVNRSTPATSADYRLPVPTNKKDYCGKGDWQKLDFELPEKWDEELAYYLGWLLGDGCISGNTITTVYAGDEKEDVLDRHMQLVTWLNGGRAPKPARLKNGTLQIRLTRRPLARFFRALGVTDGRAHQKTVPWSILEAPTPIVVAFLRGLFDADGCVINGTETRYVGYASASIELSRSIQRLLSGFGIESKRYTSIKRSRVFHYTRKDGTEVDYESKPIHDLRITGESVRTFAREVGFDLGRKMLDLLGMLGEHSFYESKGWSHPKTTEFVGFETTYNLAEPRNHSYMVNGLIVRNCSEYMHLDNSPCNLASINLLKFLADDGTFDVEAFEHAVEIVLLGQAILCVAADYPTDKIGRNARGFRELGLGYANLGALLMALGVPYDSDPGRSWAAAITSLMQGAAYRASARFAEIVGPFPGTDDLPGFSHPENRDATLRVLRKHAAFSRAIAVAPMAEDTSLDKRIPVFHDEVVGRGRPTRDDSDLGRVADRANAVWAETVMLADQFGVENSQVSVIAPTGTISFMLDCDTTGIEPDLALKKVKKLVGGGTMQIVNQTVPRALGRLGYNEEQVEAIVAFIDENNSVVNAPALKPEHYEVFACSFTEDNLIGHLGHLKMMAAAQPFLSGAISKTVNVPESASIEDMEEIFVEGWRLGLKAVAMYRDNCKADQPLSAEQKKDDGEGITETPAPAPRRRMPRIRDSRTYSFRVADTEGYIHVGLYPDTGQPGEMFIKVSKQGSTLQGVMADFALAVSMGLQHGVPLETFVEKFINDTFEPHGITDDPDIRFAKSLMDYIFRRLALDFLPEPKRLALGIRSVAEREEALNGGNGKNILVQQVEDAPKSVGAEAGSTAELVSSLDAPLCTTCGVRMRPAGNCFACESCGSTSGCS